MESLDPSKEYGSTILNNMSSVMSQHKIMTEFKVLPSICMDDKSRYPTALQTLSLVYYIFKYNL